MSGTRICNSYTEELAVCQRGQAVHLSNGPAEARHLLKGKQEHCCQGLSVASPQEGESLWSWDHV